MTDDKEKPLEIMEEKGDGYEWRTLPILIDEDIKLDLMDSAFVIRNEGRAFDLFVPYINVMSPEEPYRKWLAYMLTIQIMFQTQDEEFMEFMEQKSVDYLHKCEEEEDND